MRPPQSTVATAGLSPRHARTSPAVAAERGASANRLMRSGGGNVGQSPVLGRAVAVDDLTAVKWQTASCVAGSATDRGCRPAAVGRYCAEVQSGHCRFEIRSPPPTCLSVGSPATCRREILRRPKSLSGYNFAFPRTAGTNPRGKSFAPPLRSKNLQHGAKPELTPGERGPDSSRLGKFLDSRLDGRGHRSPCGGLSHGGATLPHRLVVARRCLRDHHCQPPTAVDPGPHVLRSTVISQSQTHVWIGSNSL